MRLRTRRSRRDNPWHGDARGHRRAALLGWAYRRSRKDPWAYLRAKGVTPADWRKYRGRHGVAKAKRKHRVKMVRGIGFLNNPRVPYRSFVKSVAAKYPRIKGPALFRKAGAMWRGGARSNEFPGAVYFNKRRGRRRSRRNAARSYAVFNPRRGRKRGRRRYSDNAVLPYAAFNPRRGRKRGRRARRNAVLPYAAFNPARSARLGPLAAFTGAFESVIDVEFWKETVFPMGAGFIGGQFAGGLVYGLVEKIAPAQVAGSGLVPSIARIGSRAAGGALLSGLAYLVTKDRDIAGKVLAGGLVAVLASVIQEVFGKDVYDKMTGMADFVGSMSADLTSELKRRIAESVRGEIARAEAAPADGVSAFVTTQDLAPAPRLGPGPRVGEMGSFVTSEALSTAPHPGSESPVVADLAAFSDNVADMMLI